jgi:hypothetical protein
MRQTVSTVALTLTVVMTAAWSAHAQGAAETFTATATLKTAGGGSASAPVTINVARKMSQSEAEGLATALRTGGAAALRKALVGVAPTGSVKLGAGAETPARVTIERTTDKGRLLTIVTDKPLLFLGAGLPDSKPKEGFDFAVIDLEVDAKGSGSGTIAPATKVTVNQGAFVVQDYGSEFVRLTSVTKVK